MGIIEKEKMSMAEKKKILFIDEAMGGGVNEEN